MDTVAAVDIGTNSVKMTVGDGTQILLDTVITTRLGKGVDASGQLAPDAMARTLDALAQFATQARALGAQRIAAVGTSALRDASNGPTFVREAPHALGGPVEVISGEREAHLTYLAARHDPDLALPSDALIATTDVGGGSSEVVVGHGNQLLFFTSLQLGAVRLTERTQPADPWTAADLTRARELLAPFLQLDLPKTKTVLPVVSSGGTAAYLGAMEQAEAGLPTTPDTFHGMQLSRERLARRIALLAALPLTERHKVPGLDPARADVIVAGALIQEGLLSALGSEHLTISARGLRYGLLYDLL